MPEIHVLAEIAAELGVRFLLRGSLARAVLDGFLMPLRIQEPSLFDFVPALSDVDIVVPSAVDAERVRAHVYAHLPLSRFFHWDVRTQADVERYEGVAFVRVQPEPMLCFAPSLDPKGVDTGLIFRIQDGDLQVHEGAPSGSMPSNAVTWKVPRTTLPFDGVMSLLLDVLYIARRCPSSRPQSRGIRSNAYRSERRDGSHPSRSGRLPC